MDNKIFEQAKQLAARNYSLAVFEENTPEGQTVFIAKNPELYGCMAEGASLEEATENLADARIDYIYSLLQDGLDVPEPTAIKAVVTSDTVSAFNFTVKSSVQFGDVASIAHKQKPAYEVILST